MLLGLWNEKYKDRSGNKQESTEWHKVVLWEKLAEIVCQYCHKGSRLYVEGSLKTREWKDKEGNRRFTTEIVGRNVQLFDFKNGNDRQNQPAKQSNYPPYGGENDGPF